MNTPAPPDHALAHLEADVDALRSTLASLSRVVGPKTRDHVILSYDEDGLHLETAGAAMTVPATGSWTGQARVAGAAFLLMHRVLPRAGQISIRVEDGKLYLGGTALPCAWEKTTQPSIPLPLNLTDLDVLKLARIYPVDRLEAAGIGTRVADAEEWLASMLDRAAKILEPLGIGRDALEALAERRLREHQTVQAASRAVQEGLELGDTGDQLEL